MKISYCCFEVSGDCNMGCAFCFSDWRETRDQMPTHKAKRVLDILKQNGLKAINLTGGECLIRDDIIQLCKYAKELGLVTIISTNGIVLKDKIKVLDYVDSINLPLDSYHPEVHNEMRPCKLKNHHALVLELIDYISSTYPNIKIKINTLVSAFNKNEVVKIGELISGKVYRWKLGKFFNGGYGKKFEDKFSISSSTFEEIVKEVSEKYPDSGFFDEDFGEEYIFIDNQGRINQITLNGTINHGEIENLASLPDINSKEVYFNKIYGEKYES